MPAISPNTVAGDTPNLLIEIGSLPIKDVYPIISVEVERHIDTLDYATIIIADGNIAEASFPISDGTDFLPGNRITISAGYSNNQPAGIFEGSITTQRVSISKNHAPFLIITCEGNKPEITVTGLNEPPLLKVAYGDCIIHFDAKLSEENRTRFVQGEVSFIGNASAKPGLTIELAGVGERFSGIHYILGTAQKIADGCWTTLVRFDTRQPKC